jgi:hypothetical protein
VVIQASFISVRDACLMTTLVKTSADPACLTNHKKRSDESVAGCGEIFIPLSIRQSQILSVDACYLITRQQQADTPTLIPL